MGCGALRAPQPTVGHSSTKTQLTEWYQHSETQPPNTWLTKAVCSMYRYITYPHVLHAHTLHIPSAERPHSPRC